MKFKELLLLAKVGDETAITAFIEHYKPMLATNFILMKDTQQIILS